MWSLGSHKAEPELPAPRSFPLTFVFVEEDEEYERLKWHVAENTKALTDNSQLIGYKRVLAVAALRDKLAAEMKACTAEAVCFWFSKIKFGESEDAPVQVDRKSVV